MTDDSELLARLQQKLEHYQPSAATISLIKNTPMLLLVGVSGAGKDTIKQELLKSGHYYHIVSHTTRAPRENHGIIERDGVEYHFIDLATAEKMLDEQAFVEAKMYSGNVYGTSVAEIQAAHDTGAIATTDIEIQGVAEYMAIDPDNTKAVFILPPSYKVWQERFVRRYGGDIDQTDFERRMHTARQELEHALHTPYFHFVVNDSLTAAVAEANRIATGTQVDTTEEIAARHIAQQICDDILP
jgi:guanylate kinase